MEQIPKIELFGFIIRITWSDRCPSWAAAGRSGCYDPNTQRIWIKTTWPEAEQRSTLVHELLHAAINARQLDQLLKSDELTDNLEETVVTRLETAWDDILSRNPDFRALWNGDESDG